MKANVSQLLGLVPKLGGFSPEGRFCPGEEEAVLLVVVVVVVVINSLWSSIHCLFRRKIYVKTEERKHEHEKRKEKCYFFLLLALFTENVDERLSIFGTTAEFEII